MGAGQPALQPANGAAGIRVRRSGICAPLAAKRVVGVLLLAPVCVPSGEPGALDNAHSL